MGAYELGLVADSYEHSNEPLSTIKKVGIS
jgi:hypothetical protein